MNLFYGIIGVIIFFIVKLYNFIKNKRKEIYNKRTKSKNQDKCLDFKPNIVKSSPYIARRDNIADYHIMIFYTFIIIILFFYLYNRFIHSIN